MKPLFWLLLFAFAASACAPVTPNLATVAAKTLAVDSAIATGVVLTLTAGAPTATPVPPDTATFTPSPLPTDTATPTHTPRPTNTARPTATETAAPTSTVTRAPVTLAPPTPTVAPLPDFAGIALAVRDQIDNFGWQIDLALRRGGLDCLSLMPSYEYVAARSTLSVPESLAGPYQLYRDGVTSFLSNGEALYLGCKAFVENPSGNHTLSRQTWTNARTQVTVARDKLTQAIIAAGGTP